MDGRGREEGDETTPMVWNSESHFPSAGSIVMASFSPEDLINATTSSGEKSVAERDDSV